MSLRPVLDQLLDFDTALLANTLGYIDPTPAHEIYMSGEIQSVTPSLGPTVGVAITCEADTSTPNNIPDTSVFWQQLAEMEKLKVPTIWVVKTVGSRPGFECVIGDGMAKLLYGAGCRGLITDGGVRDVSGILTASLATYCKGLCIHHTALRFSNPGKAVEIGGLVINQGDILHANAEGVIKLPVASLDSLVARAPAMRAFEHEAHCASRRTDLTSAEKRQAISDLLPKYGFGDCVTK